MLRLRDAREADLPHVLAITNEAIANTTAVWSLTPVTLEARRTWLAERQGTGYPVIVAEDDGNVAGFASFTQFRPWEGYVNSVEHSLYVDPAFQGRGIGKLLLSELIDRAQRMGKHTIIGGIDSTNDISLALHRRFGFEEAGRLHQVGRKFDRWLDLVFMQKILDRGAAPCGTP